ncbi:MAG: hypothetical protein NTX49_05030 [Chlamydiae bacterium]|nr:hypothetical protein [Chlamydiota bacterium]
MRYLTLFAALLIQPLFAETIGNIQYELPKSAESWQRIKEPDADDDNSANFFYVPKESSLDDASEFFVIHVNNIASVAIDETRLKSEIEDVLEIEVNLTMLEQDPDSILYEWSFGDSESFMYSITRAFFSKSGTVLLMYQTSDVKKMESEKSTWIDMLKNACPVVE